MKPPAASVIVVSDYAAGGPKSWDALRSTLHALRGQDFPGPVEYLYSESSDLATEIPTDLASSLPSLRIVLSPHRESYALKNHGVKEASAGIVVILDADCQPRADWLSRILAAFEAHPEAAAISGRTTYAGTQPRERILALLSRSYLDPGHAGITRFVANNNAAWRRSVFLSHPLPTGAGPFAARMQSEAVLRAGGKLLFDPSIRVVHEFEGWDMETDIRRNSGYASVATRLRDPYIPYAWLTRLGHLAIPLLVSGKTILSWGDCFRCWRHYGVRWYEIPLALSAACVLNAMEAPGMAAACSKRELDGTSYR